MPRVAIGDDNADLYIGVMSGTSLDGIDAVLADFSGERPAVLGSVYAPFSPALRAGLLALQVSGTDELHRAAMAANALVDCYASAVAALLGEAKVAAARVAASGAHGQTVRHRPAEGYPSQINTPARLAELTGIAVVADFRSRDVAAGGQGAPLVPAFHAALFQDPRRHRVVVNIGGMANVTSLPPGSAGAGVTGWDTGPGNVLLDAWCDRHLQQPYDRDGAWAASGAVDAPLLQHLFTDPYFALPPPKSTGRDLFDSAWLDARLQDFGIANATGAPDVQATLLQLTVESIVRDVSGHCAGAGEVLVCGGGARNSALMRALGAAIAAARSAAGSGAGGTPVVRTTDDFGVPANQVEALAFAWLARRLLRGEPGNLPAVTGARGARQLGAIYPA